MRKVSLVQFLPTPFCMLQWFSELQNLLFLQYPNSYLGYILMFMNSLLLNLITEWYSYKHSCVFSVLKNVSNLNSIKTGLGCQTSFFRLQSSWKYRVGFSIQRPTIQRLSLVFFVVVRNIVGYYLKVANDPFLSHLS